MLSRIAVRLFMAALVATMPLQPPVPSAAIQQGAPQEPPAAHANQAGAPNPTSTPNLTTLKPDQAAQTKQQREWEADYEQREAADEGGRVIGWTSIIVGIFQTIALIVTFLIIAFVASRQLRAYVEIDAATLQKNPHDPEGPWSIVVKVKNFGQTPAEVVAAKFEKYIGEPRDESHAFGFTNNADERPNIVVRIPPGHFHSIAQGCPEIATGMAGWVAQGALNHRAYMWGHIEYVDVFRFRRYLNFQMYHTFGEVHQLGLCNGGNNGGTIKWEWRWKS